MNGCGDAAKEYSAGSPFGIAFCMPLEDLLLPLPPSSQCTELIEAFFTVFSPVSFTFGKRQISLLISCYSSSTFYMNPPSHTCMEYSRPIHKSYRFHG